MSGKVTIQPLETNIPKKDEFSYDLTPYHSYPYQNSRPAHLYTLGKLFGLNPPKFDKARVLELGCAAGGNIIPHAFYYPKGEYVGVDLSKVQIDEGNKCIKELDLKNIELKHASITDIDDTYGKFDYIICHGVISWVPENVRDKIFDICKNNLNPNGIAYVSYNTLPGWNMVNTIRDMMLYHVDNFQEHEKVNQAMALLKFVSESLEGSETPYAKFLNNEVDLLSKQSAHYLRHDHLEDNNKQFYFNEFVNELRKRGSQYLSDVSISSMFLGNMPEKARVKLAEINDIVRSEQYMDFITNRRFRSTLICHDNLNINRSISPDKVKEYNLILNVKPEKKLSEIDIESNETIAFKLLNNSNCTTGSKELKAILYTFAENNGKTLSFSKVVSSANKKLKGNLVGSIEKILSDNILNLYSKGLVELVSDGELKDDSKINKEKPKLSKLAYYQITKTPYNFVTNHMHAPISVDDLGKCVIKYMDGTNTIENIIEKTLIDLDKMISEGKLTISSNDKNVKVDKKLLQSTVSSRLNHLIEICVHNNLLV